MSDDAWDDLAPVATQSDAGLLSDRHASPSATGLDVRPATPIRPPRAQCIRLTPALLICAVLRLVLVQDGHADDEAIEGVVLPVADQAVLAAALERAQAACDALGTKDALRALMVDVLQTVGCGSRAQPVIWCNMHMDCRRAAGWAVRKRPAGDYHSYYNLSLTVTIFYLFCEARRRLPGVVWGHTPIHI